ncbi:MAG: hypothetical protein ACYDIA_13725 [Candidatus Humimicrobiaceae bacterium]
MDNEVKFEAKKCPFDNFRKCIGFDCAFYDESNAIEDAENSPDKFTFCAISYLPIMFYELRQLREHRE